jgi:hypothetical protein
VNGTYEGQVFPCGYSCKLLVVLTIHRKIGGMQSQPIEMRNFNSLGADKVFHLSLSKKPLPCFLLGLEEAIGH